MSAAPRIQSIGPPPDKHAERIVHEMLHYMHSLRHAINERHKGGLFDLAKMGTPAAQQRAAEKVSNAIGALLLSMALQTAKRGKFKLLLTEWVLWDPAKNEIIKSNEPMPRDAWLAAQSVLYTGENRIPKTKERTALVVSYHACVRLAQRADVRTITDLISAIRLLWDEMDMLGQRHPNGEWLKPPRGHWYVPVTTKNGGKAIAVFTPDKDGKRRLVIKTILDPSMNWPTDAEEPRTPPTPTTRIG